MYEKDVKIIEGNTHQHLDVEGLQTIYVLTNLKQRIREHYCVLMFHKSKQADVLDCARPKIHLRSRNKIRFKRCERRYVCMIKHSMYRGIKM